MDGLRVLVEKKVEEALTVSDQTLQQEKDVIPLKTDTGVNLETSPVEDGDPDLVECTRFLRQLCPACFGGSSFGRPLEEYVFYCFSFIGTFSSNSVLSGGDFHICTDGNFHHRHLVSGGSSIPFHDPKHIVPKSFVDETGEHIAHARKLPAKHRKSRVPDEAIDECEDAYEAANGDKKKAASGEARYDDRGWMSLVCRHDIPLFFANIDTPGEQYKFAIALILWFAKHVPKHATFSVLYDIACIIHRSCLKVRPTNHDTTNLILNICSSISFLQAF